MRFSQDDLNHFIRACDRVRSASEEIHTNMTANRKLRRATKSNGKSKKSLVEFAEATALHMDVAQDVARELIRLQEADDA